MELKEAVRKSNWSIWLDSASCIVSSSMYGVTTCSLDYTDLCSGVLDYPCGDGNDFTITERQRKYLIRRIDEKLDNELRLVGALP